MGSTSAPSPPSRPLCDNGDVGPRERGLSRQMDLSQSSTSFDGRPESSPPSPLPLFLRYSTQFFCSVRCALRGGLQRGYPPTPNRSVPANHIVTLARYAIIADRWKEAHRVAIICNEPLARIQRKANLCAATTCAQVFTQPMLRRDVDFSCHHDIGHVFNPHQVPAFRLHASTSICCPAGLKVIARIAITRDGLETLFCDEDFAGSRREYDTVNIEASFAAIYLSLGFPFRDCQCCSKHI